MNTEANLQERHLPLYKWSNSTWNENSLVVNSLRWLNPPKILVVRDFTPLFSKYLWLQVHTSRGCLIWSYFNTKRFSKNTNLKVSRLFLLPLSSKVLCSLKNHTGAAIKIIKHWFTSVLSTALLKASKLCTFLRVDFLTVLVSNSLCHSLMCQCQSPQSFWQLFVHTHRLHCFRDQWFFPLYKVQLPWLACMPGQTMGSLCLRRSCTWTKHSELTLFNSKWQESLRAQSLSIVWPAQYASKVWPAQVLS